jgi:glycosyltransferase 2 family protein
VSGSPGGEVGRPAGRKAGERRGRGWSLAAQLLLTGAVTWVIVSRVGITLEEALTLEAAVPGLRPGRVALSAILLFACFWITAGLWGRMVGELGGRAPGPVDALRIVLTANLGRYLPGKVWQMAGLAVLSHRAGIPASLGAAAGVLGQLFHLAGAAVVGAAVLGARGGWGPGEVTVLAALGVLVILASVPGVLAPALGLAFRMAGVDSSRIPRPDPLFGPRWILLHALVWAGYGASFWLLLAGLGLESRVLPMAAAFSAAYLLGYLAIFAPAGIGVREGVLIALIRPSVGAGAVGVAVLARAWMTVVELVPAGALALWEIFRRRPGPAIERKGEGDG